MKNKNIIIFAIALIAVGAGAFFGGTYYEKKSLGSQEMIRSGNFSYGSNRAARPQGEKPSGGQNRGNFSTGEIISKDDQSITVKMSDGSTKIVYFSTSTTIGKMNQGTADDLAVGQNVLANGENNTDGSLSAQNIQIRP